MNILFVTSHKHLPEHFGGMEQNTHDLCHLLIQRGHKVAVACGLKGGLTTVGVKNKLSRMLGLGFSRDYLNGYCCYRSLAIQESIAAICKEFVPDIVVIQGGTRYKAIYRNCKQLGLPVITYLHSTESIKYDDSQGDTFIANSRFTAQSVNVKCAAIIPPIIKPERYRVADVGDNVTFVNPSPHKGLDIVNGLAKLNPNLRFSYVLVSAINQNSASELANVDVIGPFDDMRKVYAQTKILLAPSLCDETWGRVASEAHCSGIPVLASNAGGLPESVGEGGVCLPRESALEEWNRSLHHILEPENYREFRVRAKRYSERRALDIDFLVEQFVEQLAQRVVADYVTG